MNSFQKLAEEVAGAAVAVGFKNYLGESYTINVDDKNESFEVMITVQRVGAKTVQEVNSELQGQLTAALDVLKRVWHADALSHECPLWRDIDALVSSHDPSPEEKKRAFREHCSHCSDVVNTWPAWKRECIKSPILGHDLGPVKAINPPKGSGSDEFDRLLADLHGQVWDAAEKGGVDFDLAGNEPAKKLQALYRAATEVEVDEEVERVGFEKFAKRIGISTGRTNVALGFANGSRRFAGDYIMLESLVGFAAWVERAKGGCDE